MGLPPFVVDPMMAPPSTRAQRDHQIALKREAMRVLLTLPQDVDVAAEILALAQELLQKWLRHRGWPANE